MTPFKNTPPMQQNTQSKDRGAVLITVLLIVAVMAAVAVSLIDDIRFGIRRASNVSLTSQANWYALGAETLAIGVIGQSLQLSPEKTTLAQPWAANGGVFSIENGSIATELSDGSNCFNINSLVEKNDNSEYEANTEAQKQLRTLLEVTGIAQGNSEAIIGAITDWIDSDSRPASRGAEDFEYTAGEPAYRTPNTLIADVSELRSIKGIDRETYLTLKPWVCALPAVTLSEININTLRPDQAPLLSMLVGTALKAETVSTVLNNRPLNGFESIEVFWSIKEFEDIEIEQSARDQVKEKTTFFNLTTTVNYGDAYVTMTSLIDASENDTIYVVSRQFGEEI
jgi:general secretion pathway protein K